MSTDFLQKALNRPASKALLSKLNPTQLNMAKRLDNVLEYTNDNSLPSVASGGQADFEIRSNGFNIDRMTLRVDITNADAANAGQWNPFLAINYIEIYSNNGQNLIDRRYGRDLLLDLINIPNDEFNTIRLACGLDADYTSTSNNIVANTTTSFFMPLYGLPWSSVPFNLGYSGDILVRIYFRPSSAWLQGAVAAANLTFNTMRILLDAEALTNAQSSRIRNMIQGQGFSYPILSAQYTSTTLTLATSTQYTFTLNGVNGLISHLFLVLTQASPTPAQNEVPTAIQSFAILDDTGNNIQGGSTKLSNYSRYIEATEHFPSSSLTRNLAVYLVPFATEPKKSYDTPAQITGFFVGDNDLQLQFTTDGAITPGSYRMEVFARVFNTLTSSNGNLRLIQS
jgi:hypothetical protein